MKQLFALIAVIAILLLAPEPVRAQGPIDQLIANHLDLVDGRFYGSYRFHHERYGRYSSRYDRGYGYSHRDRSSFGQHLGRTALRVAEYGAIRAIDDRYDRRRTAIEPPAYQTYYSVYDRMPPAPASADERRYEPQVRQGGISVVNTSGSVIHVEYDGRPWELFPDGKMSVGAVVESFGGNPDKLEAFINIRCADGSWTTVPVRYKFAPNGGLRFARPTRPN